MTLADKTKQALEFTQTMLGEFKAPAVLWSSGKDSMVLLHLTRQVRPNLPVIFFREPYQSARYAFANRLIEDWELDVFEWPPVVSYLAHKNGHTSLMHRFMTNPTRGIDMPVDVVEQEGGRERMVCGRDILNRPKATFTAPWDLLFTGAKSSDSDPLAGAVPLSLSVVRDQAGPAYAFPLRTWTDADVWDYLKANAVPYQTDRYAMGLDGAMRELPDKAGNPDYLIGCMRCLRPDGPGVVYCPKLKCETNNVSGSVLRKDDILPDYMGKKDDAIPT